MIVKLFSTAFYGISAKPVRVEVDISNGLPIFNIVGLPDASVKESRERVRSAIKNSGFTFPSDKITVNLAPADLKKEGALFDLPIAIGILAAMEIIPADRLAPYLFLGELALDGSLRPVKGAIVATSCLKRDWQFVLPEENAKEACLEDKAVVYPVKNLTQVIEFLNQPEKAAPFKAEPRQNRPPVYPLADFAEVKGQTSVKRAMEIAVAGHHNILMIGSPGSGKTMLAKRIPSIMPPLSLEEALEITKIHSVFGGLTDQNELIYTPPFRAPHHSISQAAMAGGGTWPRPGEISLAHRGVLFLDEFPEFRRDVIESLRTPLEEGEIAIARSKMHLSFPAKVLLVCAMNPCPCGHLGDSKKNCRCNLGQIQKYRAKISGPILDRLDLHIEVPPVTYEILTRDSEVESSAEIRARIQACRLIQAGRFKRTPAYNALMGPKEIKKFASPEPGAEKLLERAMKELHLSARAYYKILKIGRTIADLAESEQVQVEHIAEAIQYRSLDRQW